MKLAIIGAGGHAKEVYITFKNSNLSKKYQFDGFFVENYKKKETLFDYEINDISLLNSNIHIIHIAVGDINFRRKYYKKLKELNFNFLTIIDTSSKICENVVIEEGAYISPSVTINVDCKIGKCTIINTGCNLSHEVVIGNFCNLSPGVISCGKVTVNDNCYIGAGAILRDNITIKDSIVIGMGSIVTKDINIPGTYFSRQKSIIKIDK